MPTFFSFPLSSPIKQSLFKAYVFNSCVCKAMMVCLLLIWSNMAVANQQNEQVAPENSVDEPKEESVLPVNDTNETVLENAIESANTSTLKNSAAPAPTPLNQLHKSDIKHYLSANTLKSLSAGPDDYLILITETTSINNKGIAIILPDWQQGAVSPKAINFLRQQLPLKGWTTISIQPPNKPTNYPSVMPNINEQKQENNDILNHYKIKLAALMNAAITEAKNYPGTIMIIAQGHHGAMLVDLLHSANEQSVITHTPNALILLSSYFLTSDALLNEANTNFAKQLAMSKYPVLDLYLRHDNAVVLAKATQRLLQTKKDMKVYYRQRQLNNSAMGYYPEQVLLTHISGWLKVIGW